MAKSKARKSVGEPTFEGEMPVIDQIGSVIFIEDPSEAKTPPEKELTHCYFKDGDVSFNPFEDTIQEKSIDDRAAEIEQLLEEGVISAQAALKALSKAYTFNHSMGRNLLYDRRIKPENRVRRWVAAAVSRGENANEAFEYAVKEIVKQRKVAGNWGSLSKTIDIRDIMGT